MDLGQRQTIMSEFDELPWMGLVMLGYLKVHHVDLFTVIIIIMPDFD